MHVPPARRRQGLVDTVFEAVDDPQVRPQLLKEIGTLFGTSTVALALASAAPEGPAEGPSWVMESLSSHGMPQAAIATFVRNWMARDGTTLPSLHGLLNSSAPTGVYVRQQYIPDPVFERSAFYNEFTRPLDQYHYMWSMGQLPAGRGWWALNLCRPQRMGDFDAQETAFLGWLVPHLHRAQRLHLRLAQLERASGVQMDALDALTQPCLAVRTDGQLLWANAAAGSQRVLADGPGAGGDPQLPGERRRHHPARGLGRLRSLRVHARLFAWEHAGGGAGLSGTGLAAV